MKDFTLTDKRVVLLSGHYGSGKTNISVNLAERFAAQIEAGDSRWRGVSLADLDIVNPYFRSADSADELMACGVRLICSAYVNTNIDVPALPQEMYSIVDDRSVRAVIDVGGDERGALALGRLSERIISEHDYDMFLVINRFRPLTRTAADTVEIAREIEIAGHLPFTGIINCSNLGAETEPDTVLSSMGYAEEVSKLMNIPVVATAVEEHIYKELTGKIEHLLPLKLQKRPI